MYIVVVGGGKVGYYLAKELLEAGHELVILEKNAGRARQIADELGSIVLNRDGCEGKHLAEAGANRAAIVAAVTGDDEDNLVVCQMAKHHFDVPRTIARVNNPKNEELFRHLGVDEIISPTRMALASIEQDIPVHELLHLAQLKGGELDLVEAQIAEDSPAVGRRATDIPLPEGCSLFVLLRGNNVLPIRAGHGLPGRRQRAGGDAHRVGDAAAARADRRRRARRDCRTGRTLTAGIATQDSRTTDAGSSRRRLPSAASILRRSLLIWGSGHIALGDRRGWLLVVLQPLAIGALLLAAIQLIDGTRWLAIFPPLAALLVAWLAQAVHAYRLAVELGAKAGGEMQAALFLPLAVAVLTTYWLVGGRHGSPSATMESYVVAWMAHRVDAATGLYVQPPPADTVDQSWAAQSGYLAQRVAALAAQFGPTSGLDPAKPFDSLRFGQPSTSGPGHQLVTVDIVRRQRVETFILGIVPTASQETVVVERAGTLNLALVEQPPIDWLSFARLPSSAWRIEAVSIGAN